VSSASTASARDEISAKAGEVVERVFEWLEPRIPAEPALDRALALNLAPFLTGWATGRGADQAEGPTNRRAAWRRLRRDLGDYRPHLGEMPEEVASAERQTMPADLLAVCLQPNATRAFLPVAVRMHAAGVRVRFLLEYGDQRSSELILSAGIPFCTTPPLGRPELWPAFTAASLRLARFWRDRPGLEAFVRSLGMPGSVDGHVRHLRKELRRAILRGTWRGAAIESALRALPAQNVLFVTHRALLNHLFRSTHPAAGRYFFLQGIVPDVPPLRTELDVDHAIVGSELDLPYVLRCGIERSAISITGYPDYDHYVLLDRDACRAEVEGRIPSASGRPLVVFTSQYKTSGFPDAARLRNFDALLATARAMPEVEFVAKLHPRMEAVPLVELPRNVVLEQHTDTARLIKAADVLVTFWSTTAVEAILLGTPLVQLNATALPDFLDLSTSRGRPIARSASDLERMLREVLAAPRDLDTARSGNWLSVELDGHAADRASQVLLAHLNRR